MPDAVPRVRCHLLGVWCGGTTCSAWVSCVRSLTAACALLLVPRSYGMGTVASLREHMASVAAMPAALRADSAADQWRAKLNTITQAVRGAAALLPSLPGVDGDEGVLPLGRVGVGLPGDDATPLRNVVTQFTADAARHLRAHRSDDTKTLDLLTVLSNQLLTRRGIRRAHRDRYYAEMRVLKRSLLSRALQRELRARYGRAAGTSAGASRFHMVSRAELHHLGRVGLSVYIVPKAIHLLDTGDAPSTDVLNVSHHTFDAAAWKSLENKSLAEHPSLSLLQLVLNLCVNECVAVAARSMHPPLLALTL